MAKRGLMWPDWISVSRDEVSWIPMLQKSKAENKWMGECEREW